MKKLLLSVVTLGLAITGFAQEKANFAPASKAEILKVNKKVINTITEKGASIFEEDFANGLDGNNGIGAWTAVDSEGGDIWHVANGTPEGEFSTTIAALASTTAANGWMIFDADQYNTPVASGVVDLQGFLTSPSIDMSEEPSVIIEFQQYFRYCCFGTFPMAVEVSNDGGTTWITFPSNDYFIPSANALSDDMTTTIDISCAAGGEADVQIRFTYNVGFETGYSHYFWGVDDVLIYGNPNTNDLAIDLVTNGDIYNNYEYRVTPMDQVVPAADGGVLVGTYYENYGSSNQTNVTVTVEILDEAGTVLSTNTTAPFDLLSFANSPICPNETDSVYIATGWEPSEPGNYVIRSTMASDATDDTPADNVVEKTIEFTEFTMGHDDPDNFDLELRQSTDDTDNFESEGFASMVTMHNAGTEAYGAVVYFGPNTTPGLNVAVKLYTVALVDVFVDLTDAFEFTEYEIQPEDIPSSIGNPIPTFIEFESIIELESNDINSYGIAVETISEGEGELTVLANGNLDSDNSSAVIDLTGDQEYAYFPRPDVPAVRLVIGGEFVGIDEVEAISGVSALQNAPNPASNNTIISYNLENTLEVNIVIVDITGKTVYAENQGTQVAGQHQVTIDASSMADGVYFYSLVSGDQRMTRKMVVSK